MNPSPEYHTSADALADVVAPGQIHSPLSERSRKALRVVMVLLGLFVLGAVAVGYLGQKTKKPFSEESNSLDPWGRGNPWGRR